MLLDDLQSYLPDPDLILTHWIESHLEQLSPSESADLRELIPIEATRVLNRIVHHSKANKLVFLTAALLAVIISDET